MNKICTECGKKIRKGQASEAYFHKALGKLHKHLVCPIVCETHKVENCDVCSNSTGDIP